MSKLRYLAVGIALLVMTMRINSRLLESPHLKKTFSSEGEPMSPEFFEVMAWGQIPAALDGLWLTLLADSSLEHLPPGKHSSFYYGLNVLSDVDPLFQEVFEVGATLLAIARRDIQGAYSLLKKGDEVVKNKLPELPEKFRVTYWKRSWSLSLLLGYLSIFEFHDMPQAAVHFQRAAKLPGSPSFLHRLEQKFASPGGQYVVALQLLDFLILGARDQATKENLLIQKKSLLVSYFLFDLNDKFSHHLGSSFPNKDRFSQFLKRYRIHPNDSWGGALTLSSNGKIVSTTEHEKVFGLE